MARIITYSMILILVEFMLFAGGVPTLSNQLWNAFDIGGMNNYLAMGFYALMLIYIGLLALSGISVLGVKIASESSALSAISIPIFAYMALDLLSLSTVIVGTSPFVWIIRGIVAVLFVGYCFSFIQWLRGNDI